MSHTDSTELDTAITYFLNTYFLEDGTFKPDVIRKHIDFFSKFGLVVYTRGKYMRKSFDDIKKIVIENSLKNPYYITLFCQTMCDDGINTIFPLLLRGNKPGLTTFAFDPIKNRNRQNSGTLCRILYKGRKYEFVAGNGSMRNVKNEGNTFFSAIGINNQPHNFDTRVKFSVVHKMDGRYVALYISKIMTDSGIPSTIVTIHSRRGVVIGSGLYIDGPEEEMKNFSVEYDFMGKERVAVVNYDGSVKLNSKGKEESKFVDKILFSKSFGFVSDIRAFVPSTIQRTSEIKNENGETIINIVTDNLISIHEIKSAFEISHKLSYLVGLDEMMLINCEGTKDNMRPLFDKFIVENQDTYQGLFPHPFGTVIYDISEGIPNASYPKKYLSDPTIFSNNGIDYCQIFYSPSNNPFWNTTELLHGLVQKDVIFDNSSTPQKLYSIVDYVNKIVLKFLQSHGKYTDAKTESHPGHICEGVIICAHLPDGSFACMKVKDDLFSDDEEKAMKLESI